MAAVPRFVLPIFTGLVILAVWWIAYEVGAFPTGTIPSPPQVAVAFGEELESLRVFDDAIASLYRIAWGFITAILAAVPLGLLIGRSRTARDLLMPWVNFFRNMSPIAWIPFAIVWFGIGDPPAIFIIFLATFFQIVLATAAAASTVPKIYYRVAEDMGLTSGEILFRITFPAILPQLVIALRVAIGVAWMVDVAAEMIAVRSGLGFLIWDARNGARMDLMVSGMVVIGAIGMTLDLLFARLQKIPSVRWGFER
jgi:NitT/TauT family transport system permease protein